MDRIKSIAVVLFVTFVLFLSLEVVLHIALGRYRPILYEPNASYLARFKSNMDLLNTFHGNFRLQTNSFGFRDDRKDYDGRPKIMVYGDSNIAALFAPIEASFPRRLENYLMGRFTVINAGVPGFGPDQSFLRMQDEVRLLKPAWVILHIFADNDYGDLLRNNLFVSTGNGLERTKRPMSDRSFGLVSIFGVPLRTVDVTIRLHQKLSEPVKVRSIQEGLSARLNEYEQYRQGGFSSFLTDDYDFDNALRPDTESSRYKVQLMRDLLAEVQRYAEDVGFRLLVLLQPSSSDLTTNIPSTNYSLFTSFSGYRSINLTEPIVAFCRARGIHLVNLYPIFAASNPEALYFEGENNHWNVAGMDLAARMASSFLTHNDTVPALSNPTSQLP